MASIQFDSTEILDSTHIPQFVKHESVADRQIASLPRAREDGQVIIYERYNTKLVTLAGTLIGSSSDDLDSKIDTFIELFSRVEKNLDLTWNGGTRRYVATCSKHNFDRDGYNTNAVPWTAEFTVLAGEGKDTSDTTVKNNTNYVTVTTPGADSFTLAGSKPGKPVITLDGSTDAPHSLIWPTGCLGVQYKNTDSGEKIIVTNPGTWPGTTKSVVINCDTKQVFETITTGSSKESAFYGTFPTFIVGTNNIEITAGALVAVTTTENVYTSYFSYSEYQITSGTNWNGQGFSIPYTDATFQGITVYAGRLGSPGDLIVSIYADNGSGKPGSLVTGATATIPDSSFVNNVSIKAYVTGYFAAPVTLTANTQYYVVMSAAGANTSGGGNIYLFFVLANILATGDASYQSSNSGSTWSTITNGNQMAIKVLFGGLSATGKIIHQVVYRKKYL